MNLFIKKILIFSIIFFTILFIGILLPATPRSSESLLFAKIDKDSLLKNVKSPRLILVGGSNLSFGIDSKMIEDSLNLNVINTGIQASIGLSFMLNNTLKFIKEKDIVIIIPEYDNYFGDFAFGSDVLLRTILDVSPNDINLLNFDNYKCIIGYIPEYAFSKFKISEYSYKEKVNEKIYKRSAFNKYGDAIAHLNLTRQNFAIHPKITDKFNITIIEQLMDFSNKLELKKTKLFISFPGYQESSFNECFNQISEVERELIKGNFKLMGSPIKYKMADTMMFNSPYHLNKTGIRFRTTLLINDLKAILQIP